MRFELQLVMNIPPFHLVSFVKVPQMVSVSRPTESMLVNSREEGDGVEVNTECI